MPTKLNDEDRKLLTEFMGECWHDWEMWTYQGTYGYNCKKCTERRMSLDGRTFDTGNDLLDLKKKLVEKGDWFRFRNYAHCKWFEIEGDKPDTFEDYLIDEHRFPALIIEAIRKELYHENPTCR